jgi:hypothetical protein
VHVRLRTPGGWSATGPSSRYTFEPSLDRCRAAAHDGSASVASDDLLEISGVAASREQQDVLWVHNDSGGAPDVYAVGIDGSHAGRFTVDGAQAVDWEDLAIGPGPAADGDHLFVGDIGDNFGTQRFDDPIRIYRIPEPQVTDPPGGDGTSPLAAIIPIAYADGPRDAEALLSDPLTGDLVVVSKQWDGTAAGVYVVPAAVATAVTPGQTAVTLPRTASVAESASEMFTGGDVSPDGGLVALRTYAEVWLWERDAADTVAETLQRPPTCTRVVTERQGEAVGFSADGTAFVTISEGAHPQLNWFQMG